MIRAILEKEQLCIATHDKCMIKIQHEKGEGGAVSGIKGRKGVSEKRMVQRKIVCSNCHNFGSFSYFDQIFGMKTAGIF